MLQRPAQDPRASLRGSPRLAAISRPATSPVPHSRSLLPTPLVPAGPADAHRPSSDPCQDSSGDTCDLTSPQQSLGACSFRLAGNVSRGTVRPRPQLRCSGKAGEPRASPWLGAQLVVEPGRVSSAQRGCAGADGKAVWVSASGRGSACLFPNQACNGLFLDFCLASRVLF